MTLRTGHEPNRFPACAYQRPRRPAPAWPNTHSVLSADSGDRAPLLPSAPLIPTASAIRQIHQCTLPATPQSCRAARRFADRTLTEWGVRQLADELFLVISELVTNAVRHGVGLSADPLASTDPLTSGQPVDEHAGHGADHPIQVTLLRDDRQLVCAVTDPSDAPPMVTEAEESREGGRGLRLVEAFSQLWGWTPMGSGGKVVWAAFPVPSRTGRTTPEA